MRDFPWTALIIGFFAIVGIAFFGAAVAMEIEQAVLR